MSGTCDQWQYCFVLCRMEAGDWIVSETQPASTGSSRGRSIWEVIQELGEVGWEVSTSLPDDESLTARFVFKRPAAAQPLEWAQQAGLAGQLIQASACIRESLFMLSNPQASLRLEAIETLQQIEDQLAADVLAYALHNPISAVRDRAACALGMKRDMRGQPLICEILRRVEDEPSRTSLLAAAAAAQLGDRESLVALRDRLKRMNDRASANDVANALLKVMPRDGTKWDVSFLFDLMEGLKAEEYDSHSAMRGLLKALVDQKDKRAVGPIIEAYDSLSTATDYYAKDTRCAVVEALGALADAAAMPLLVRVVDQTEDYEEGNLAADALRQIGGDEALHAAERWDARRASVDRRRSIAYDL